MKIAFFVDGIIKIFNQSPVTTLVLWISLTNHSNGWWIRSNSHAEAGAPYCSRFIVDFRVVTKSGLLNCCKCLDCYNLVFPHFSDESIGRWKNYGDYWNQPSSGSDENGGCTNSWNFKKYEIHEIFASRTLKVEDIVKSTMEILLTHDWVSKI